MEKTARRGHASASLDVREILSCTAGNYFTQQGRVFEKGTLKNGAQRSAAEPNGNTNARNRKQSHLAEFSTLHFFTHGAEYNRVRSIHPKIYKTYYVIRVILYVWSLSYMV
jgi:hypothetical protein